MGRFAWTETCSDRQGRHLAVPLGSSSSQHTAATRVWSTSTRGRPYVQALTHLTPRRSCYGVSLADWEHVMTMFGFQYRLQRACSNALQCNLCILNTKERLVKSVHNIEVFRAGSEYGIYCVHIQIRFIVKITWLTMPYRYMLMKINMEIHVMYYSEKTIYSGFTVVSCVL